MVEVVRTGTEERAPAPMDTLWVMTADTTLAPGDSLTLLWDPEGTDFDPPARLGRGVIIGRLKAGPRDRGGFMDPEEGDVFYLARTVADSTDIMGLGFGVKVPAAAFHRSDRGWVEADLDGDGTPERFHVCASYEGLHFNVWSGPPNQGVLRWTRYFYVPYATEPTCVGLPEEGPDR
jgi:hypothetical protein